MYETQKLDKETFINCKCLSKAIDDKIYPEAKEAYNMNTILEIENLCKYYGKQENQTKALDGITFQVMKGEFLGIMEAAVPANQPS